MGVSATDFNFLRTLVKSKSGISLSEDKEYLVDSRLLPLSRKLGLNDIAELVAKVRMTKDQSIIMDIVEAMTTNETLFFRDLKPFDCFRDKIIPHILSKNHAKDIKVWCGACSTGQEPYSLSMILLENKHKLNGAKVKIVGTDINKSILKRAEEAVYSQFEVQRGLPIAFLMKYFTQEKRYGEKWLLKDTVKELVAFEYLNLLDSYAHLGKFDVIFCRNVLIYFEADVKKQILKKLAGNLKPHGVLFLGSSETITDLSTDLVMFNDNRSVFCLK